jgi:nitrous oxidase accessory protein
MHKHAVLLLVLVLLTGSCHVPTLSADAEPKTIIVPDDYPTISLAIDNVLDGEIIFVKKGIYDEQTLEINKSLSLIGEDVSETIINLNPPLVNLTIFTQTFLVHSTAITINTNNVKLSSFTINMPGGLSATGDRIEIANNILAQDNLVITGALLNISGNELSSLTVKGSNQTIANNSITGALDSQGSYNKIIENSIYSEFNLKESSFNLVAGNSFSFLYMEHSDLNFICNNSFSCLWMEDACSNNTVSKNRVTGPGLWGILMGAGAYNVFHDNLICNYTGSHDGYGIAIGGNHLVAEHNTFYRNIFINNSKHVSANWEILGTGNYWDNGREGNYWDDYTGIDINWDGIGDVPYTVEGFKWDDNAGGLVSFIFGQDNYPLMAPFNIDSVSIKLPEWASSSSGILPEPKTPESFPVAPVAAASVAVAAVVGGGLLVYLKKRKTIQKT